MSIDTIVGLIGLVVGVPSLVLAWPAIKNWTKSLRARHIILLFGPKAAGKTTLVRYLQGKPLPRRHVQTHGHERSGKIVYDLSGNNASFFTIRDVLDVGGEFKQQLKRLIADDNPHAIVFICDTTDPNAEKEALQGVADACDEILTKRPAAGFRARVLLILLNKCDLWGNDPATQNAKQKHYDEILLFEPLQQLRKSIRSLEVRLYSVSLTHAEYRLQTDGALRELALLLEERPR